MQALSVQISDLAALVGRHPYRDQSVELARWIKRYNPALARDFMAERRIQPADLRNAHQVLNDQLKFMEVPEAVVEQIKAVQTTDDIAKNVKIAAEHGIDAKVAEQALQMKVGTRRETDAWGVYLKYYGHDISKGKKLSKALDVGGGREITLVGIPDAIDASDTENPVVIEIKTRRHKCFGELREYERVQLQMYLWMLGYDDGGLLEVHKGSHDFHRDRLDSEFVEGVLDELKTVLNNVFFSK